MSRLSDMQFPMSRLSARAVFHDVAYMYVVYDVRDYMSLMMWTTVCDNVSTPAEEILNYLLPDCGTNIGGVGVKKSVCRYFLPLKSSSQYELNLCTCIII